MKTRHGCLAALGLFLLYCAISSWISPGDAYGLPCGGLLALVLIYVGSGIEHLTTKKRKPDDNPPNP